MGEEKKENAGQQPKEQPKNIIALAVILNTDTKTVEVSGPIGDKVLCYGMLTAAHDAIKDCHDKARAGAQPKPGMLGFVRGMKH